MPIQKKVSRTHRACDIQTNLSNSNETQNEIYLDARTRKQLFNFQLETLEFVNDKRNHIPPITNSDSFPFPIEITVTI